jgi:hypothetical protein
MASTKGSCMRINWVLSEHIALDPLTDIEAMKNIGSFWGSWSTWRTYQTDNVICHEQKRASEFLKRNFQNTCNFYIPNSVYVSLDRPEGVNLYEGDFKDDTIQSEDIVAMHLAASVSDLVLLVGFDVSEKPKNPDRLAQHRAAVYLHLVKKVIEGNPQVQWVLVDHQGALRKDFTEISNLTTDTLETALSLAEIDT